MAVARLVAELHEACVRPIQMQLVNDEDDGSVLYSLEMEDALDRLEADVVAVTISPTDAAAVESIDAMWTNCADILVQIALQHATAASLNRSSSSRSNPIAVFRVVNVLVTLIEGLDSLDPLSSSSSTTPATVERWAATMLHACSFYLCSTPPSSISTDECQASAKRILAALHHRLLRCTHHPSSSVDLFPRLLPHMLSLFASKSSKDEWVATGAVPPRAFAWFVQQVSFPHFSSDVVGRVLALALPLLDQVTPATQVVGLSLLHHLLKHGTATDIRWYSDLLVHEMEQTLTTAATSASFLDATLACLEDLLAVLSPSKQDVTLYDRYFPSLLRQWDMSLDVAVKTVFTAHARVWVARLGAPHSLHLLRYLQPLVKVILGCVESAERTLSVEALKTLQAVIVAAWIRMPGHAEHITLAILK
ncbi:hypothetical protein, variant [Aphanomyces astaci]|nr:hypothetical protein, variant [Aphanomyces astaci]ETV76137.1 hypothetical protein, variant [Aphanomyces astaci]|eukprot:XP_009834262.1 hypothetical protein, variant [Aphanomyces astaci]